MIMINIQAILVGPRDMHFYNIQKLRFLFANKNNLATREAITAQKERVGEDRRPGCALADKIDGQFMNSRANYSSEVVKRRLIVSKIILRKYRRGGTVGGRGGPIFLPQMVLGG